MHLDYHLLYSPFEHILGSAAPSSPATRAKTGRTAQAFATQRGTHRLSCKHSTHGYGCGTLLFCEGKATARGVGIRRCKWFTAHARPNKSQRPEVSPPVADVPAKPWIIPYLGTNHCSEAATSEAEMRNKVQEALTN